MTPNDVNRAQLAMTAERAALQEKLKIAEDQNKDYGEIFDKYEATVTELKAENTRLWGALKEESAEVIHLREFLNANRKYIGDIPARTVRAQQIELAPDPCSLIPVPCEPEASV